MASSSNPPPSERAEELVNKLPSSPGLITKTGSAILGAGLVATAISQELYVMNEETVIAVGFIALASFIAKVRATSLLAPGQRTQRNAPRVTEHARAVQGVG